MHNITHTHLSQLVIPPSSEPRYGGGKQCFYTLPNILQDVTLHSKPHRAIYPTLESRTEKGYSAKDVKAKINVSSGAATLRDLSSEFLKNGHMRNKG